MTMLKLFREHEYDIPAVLYHEDDRSADICDARRRMKASGHTQTCSE